MKTIITSTGKSKSDLFDKRFGRAAFFCVFDETNKKVEFHENPYKEAASGAGVKTAEMAVKLKATKVISGHFGPKAKELLEKFDIQLVVLEQNMKVSEIIEKLS